MKTKFLMPLMSLIAALVLSCASKPAPEPVQPAQPEAAVVDDTPIDTSIDEPIDTPISAPLDISIDAPADTPIKTSIAVSFAPEYFSPDGDGDSDTLFITLKGENVASWTFDIMQPTVANREGQAARVFKHFDSATVSGEVIEWDGRSDPHERRVRNQTDAATQPATRVDRVMSATDYPYVLTATNKQGITGEPLTGVVHVDVLVIQGEDGRARIQVPSIVFRPNAADFNGLDPRIVANNLRVVRRIASILKKFPGYKITVEGHANPENAPGTKARTNEEKAESKKGSVSEKRAQAIVNMLAEDGIEKALLTAVGIGVSKPIADFDDIDNLWKNRRVEFYLQK